MFRKILIVAMFATAAGYCFAADNLPQVVTSEVFYTQDRTVDENQYVEYDTVQTETVETTQSVVNVPAWTIAGSDGDVEV